MFGECVLFIVCERDSAGKCGQIVYRDPFEFRVVFDCGWKGLGIELLRGDAFSEAVNVIPEFVLVVFGNSGRYDRAL